MNGPKLWERMPSGLQVPVNAGYWVKRKRHSPLHGAGKKRRFVGAKAPHRRLSPSQCQGPTSLQANAGKLLKKVQELPFRSILGHCAVEVVSEKSRNV